MEMAMIIAIAELVLKHGVPAALSIIKAWEVENPTADDFRELAERMPEASTYFNDAESETGRPGVARS